MADLAVFVDAVGRVLGSARDSLGPGVSGDSWSSRSLSAADGSGSGRAAAAAMDAHTALAQRNSALAAADARVVSAANAAADSHRGHVMALDRVIKAAGDDVSSLGPAARTSPSGQRALVDALTQRLSDGKSAYEDAIRDGKTHAGNVRAATDKFRELLGGEGTKPAALTAGTAPAAAARALGGLGNIGSPAAALGPVQALGGMATPLTGIVPTVLGAPAKVIGPILGGLGSFIQPGAFGGAGAPAIGGGSGVASATAGSGTGLGTNSAAAIAPGDVRFDKVKFPGGMAAVNGYIDQALDAHGITDPAARARWKSLLPVGIHRESGFDTLAVNKTDSNAHGARQIDGAPFNSSRSLMQTIPTTFAANHQPGTSNYIYDPVANIAAGMNYLMRRYNVGRGAERLTSVGQFNPHHSAGGY